MQQLCVACDLECAFEDFLVRRNGFGQTRAVKIRNTPQIRAFQRVGLRLRTAEVSFECRVLRACVQIAEVPSWAFGWGLGTRLGVGLIIHVFRFSIQVTYNWEVRGLGRIYEGLQNKHRRREVRKGVRTYYEHADVAESGHHVF